MTIREVIQSDIEESVKKAGFNLDQPINVSYPANFQHGDYTTSWPLQAAANNNQSPVEIAKKIQGTIAKSEVYDPPEVSEQGFINFRLSREFLLKHLQLAISEGGKFGSSSVGKGKTVVLDYSAPNIAKPMHAGQLRNTNLGQSLENLLESQGYQTISDNHIGDWGTQFGKLLYAYKTWAKDLKDPTIQTLLALYIRFHQEAQTNPDLEKFAREEFRKLEQGDKENRSLWEKFRSVSLIEFDAIYQRLGIKFDVTYGESFYEKDLPKIIDQALGSGAATQDPDGSVVIHLDEFGLPPFLIRKSDGATLYGTRDLATAKFRIEKWHPDRVLYVIGSEQALYLQQLFAALQKLKWGQQVKWQHISYGLTRLPEGSMSTRSGDLVTAEEVISEAEARAERLLKEKGSEKRISPELRQEIAIGAIKWNDLKLSRESEVVFDWDKIFSLEGNSGPYIQYSYARTQSILSKASPSEKSAKFSTGVSLGQSELVILRLLVRFPEVVALSAQSGHPHQLASYIYDLAQAFGRFYELVPVLQSEKEQKVARLAIVEAVGNVLSTGLHLLAIKSPSKL